MIPHHNGLFGGAARPIGPTATSALDLLPKSIRFMVVQMVMKSGLVYGSASGRAKEWAAGMVESDLVSAISVKFARVCLKILQGV